jgi:hypothetical protein
MLCNELIIQGCAGVNTEEGKPLCQAEDLNI